MKYNPNHTHNSSEAPKNGLARVLSDSIKFNLGFYFRVDDSLAEGRGGVQFVTSEDRVYGEVPLPVLRMILVPQYLQGVPDSICGKKSRSILVDTVLSDSGENLSLCEHDYFIEITFIDGTVSLYAGTDSRLSEIPVPKDYLCHVPLSPETTAEILVLHDSSIYQTTVTPSRSLSLDDIL